uniref:Uncharacterized protein n=1 Tax=Setaria digitata TaxID=48799 RepID=A0A915PWG4_9BILA
MTQIPTETQKKSTVTQAAPSVKKKNSSRRNSRSRSRGRHSRRPTPLRTLASQTIVKSESAEKLYPTAVRRSVRNTAKGDSVLFENLSLQTPVRAYETTYGTEKSRRLSSFIDHPYVLTFIYFLLCVLYAFIICKAVNYFGVDRFVMKHWIQWSKQIRSSMSS